MNAYKTTIKLLVSNGYILKGVAVIMIFSLIHGVKLQFRLSVMILMRMICVIFLKKQALS